MKSIFNHVKDIFTLGIIVAIIVVSSIIGYYQTQSLRIFFFDLGQGDSFLIETPDKKTLLVDGGDGKTDLLAKLRSYLPIWQKLDAVLLTHLDKDHIGRLPEVVQQFQPGLIFLPAVPEESLIPSNVKTTLIKSGESEEGNNQVKRFSPHFGQEYILGCCVKLNFFWPLTSKVIDVNQTNENSLTFILTYGNFRFWAGGDLPLKEEDLLSDCCLDKAIDVLKVDHHGSKTSTSDHFLTKIKTKTAIIQVGRGNTYGHPTSQVLDTLRSHEIVVYRTDQDGDIELNVNDKYFQLRKKGVEL